MTISIKATGMKPPCTCTTNSYYHPPVARVFLHMAICVSGLHPHLGLIAPTHDAKDTHAPPPFSAPSLVLFLANAPTSFMTSRRSDPMACASADYETRP